LFVGAYLMLNDLFAKWFKQTLLCQTVHCMFHYGGTGIRGNKRLDDPKVHPGALSGQRQRWKTF